eukprot:9553985-Lingulodinium_polyedra.AAC.1
MDACCNFPPSCMPGPSAQTSPSMAALLMASACFLPATVVFYARPLTSDIPLPVIDLLAVLKESS